MPGPRNTVLPALPKSPRAGLATKFGSIHWSVLPFLRYCTGPVRLTRVPSPPPAKSKLSEVASPTPDGVPLASVVTPENCQLSNTALTTRVLDNLLAGGRSQM